MPRALPRRKDKFSVPADRINCPYGWSLPYRGWHIGEKEGPGEEGELRCGGRIAFFLGLLLGEPPSLLAAVLWEPRRHETTGSARLGSEKNSVLRPIAPYGCEPSGQGQRGPLPRFRGPEGRLRMEATDTRRPSGSKARQGCDVTVASIQEQAHALVR